MERVILAEEVKELMTFEDRSENEQNGRTVEFYESYIDELEVGIKGWISKHRSKQKSRQLPGCHLGPEHGKIQAELQTIKRPALCT